MTFIMMKQIIAATAFAILTLVSAQSNAASPSTCAVGCVNGVFVNAVGIGCASGDNVCVCKKTDSFYGGIRDCITQACAPQDVPSVQIPLANAYGDSLCARYEGVQTPTSAPTTSTQATPTPTPSETGGSTTPTVTPSMSTPISSADPFSSGAAISAGTASTASDPATIEATPTTTPALSLVTSSSSSPTAPSTSASSNPATTSGNTTSSGLSTAVKAGIGAGVGAAALAGIIIGICVCLRRRRNGSTDDRVRKYKISEPMSASDRRFVHDVGRAETALPKPIITTRPTAADTAGLPVSPTSIYSNSSDLESHAKRYEDMLPRTKPRTMI